MEYKNIDGVHFLKLKGNYLERTRQHAKVLSKQIKKGALIDLAKKNEWLLRRAGGLLNFKPIQNFVVFLYHKVVGH